MNGRHERISENVFFTLLLAALAGWLVLLTAAEFPPAPPQSAANGNAGMLAGSADRGRIT